jgi:pimeloyl-ACP methyl ester carboxylesterase
MAHSLHERKAGIRAAFHQRLEEWKAWLSERDMGPEWNSFKDAPKVKGNKPLVCVAGLASSTLEASFDDGKTFEVSYCSISALATAPETTLKSLRMLETLGTLHDGRQAVSACDAAGVIQRPVKGTAGISTLNPGEAIPVEVWKGFVDAMQAKVNVHALNYDWRRFGDLVYMEELEVLFHIEVESAFEHSEGKRVTLVGHSMGAPVILYCLSQLGEEWTKKYIENVVFVAPAHVGSPCMLPSLAHGVIHNEETKSPYWEKTVEVPQFLEVLDKGLGDLCATWPCMVAEMPVVVGGVMPWPADFVFAKTPTKEYKLLDLRSFLLKAAESEQGRLFPSNLYPGVVEMYGKMHAPHAPTHIIYGDKIDTIAQVSYETEDVTLPCTVARNDPGDGTITADAIKTVANAWIEQGHDIKLVACPDAITHKNLIVADMTVEYVSKLMGVDVSE